MWNLLGWVVVIASWVVCFRVLRRWARSLRPAGEAEALRRRVETLEDTVDALESANLDLREQNEFTSHLLKERVESRRPTT